MVAPGESEKDMNSLEERVEKLEEIEIKRLEDENEKLRKRVLELEVEKEISEIADTARRVLR